MREGEGWVEKSDSFTLDEDYDVSQLKQWAKESQRYALHLYLGTHVTDGGLNSIHDAGYKILTITWRTPHKTSSTCDCLINKRPRRGNDVSNWTLK